MISRKSIVKSIWTRGLLGLFSLVCLLPATAQDKPAKKAATPIYPVAVFPFQERGREVSEVGKQVTDLLFANLVVNPELYLVEREDLAKILQEQELSVSGVVNPASANKVGQLTGAKILVTGSVLEVNGKLYLVAKVIGTETSRVLGASVKGNVGDDLDRLAEQLGAEVGKTIVDRASDLVAQTVSREDRVAALKKAMGGAKLPSVFIRIDERHVGQSTIDPAAETEIAWFCRELGFDVIDSDRGSKADADVLIVGEGVSEFAASNGNLKSVKSRLEVKALDRETGAVIAIDRDVAIAIDLTEQIAGKAALQDAAASIASRLLPKLASDKKDVPKQNRRK
ncbi:Curli production assembly/transport component CsgG [Novipirellula aureliae]|uniref:Curli production assembly/transport component CsgG n=1 Tax=Novipirellula aureliae TaxID=2527966 RepID=A0A5C6EEK4_9BACT|nr:CsgG/HfaB family protein [Novipirellula aureliae]TWU45659.1 Curli production assembly/transport component CsgG [Novipirellula aureliae]